MHQRTRIPKGATRPRIDARFLEAVRRKQFTGVLAELCLEQGYATTTVTDIVARAGTARNTFYEYFPNRAALFFELVERASAEFLSEFDSGLAAADAAEHASSEVLRKPLRWVAESHALAAALLIEAPCGGERSLRTLLAFEEALAGRFRRLVEPDRREVQNRDLLVVGGAIALIRGRLFDLDSEGVPPLVSEIASLIHAARRPLPFAGRQG